jgi:hypothetical protein
VHLTPISGFVGIFGQIQMESVGAAFSRCPGGRESKVHLFPRVMRAPAKAGPH